MAFKNKRFLKLMLACMISVQVVGCGTSANDNTEKNSEVVKESENISEETESEIDSEIDSEKDTQVSTNNSESEVIESEKVDENNSEKENKEDKEKPVHTCDFATLKTDANNHWYACSCGATSGKASHNYDDEYDASCNTCGYTRSVPEKPVEPSKPSSNVNWNGGDITLDSIGVKIPTLTEFNKTGLESTGGDWWWTGSENDKSALSAMNRIYLTCEDFFDGLVAVGHSNQSINAFTVSRNRIWFSWSSGDMEHFSLSRDPQNGYYVLTINQSLKSQDYFGVDTAVWNRDVVKTLISFVSSEVNTVYGAIYEDLTGTEQFDGSWKTVGDCKVMFDYGSSCNGHYVYKIKGK